MKLQNWKENKPLFNSGNRYCRQVAEVSDALVQADKLKQQEQIATAQVDTLHHAIFNAQVII